MGFNTLPFIFIFLPVFLAVYYLMPERLRNGVLALGSLVFYLLGTWKRPWCLALLLGLQIFLPDRDFIRPSWAGRMQRDVIALVQGNTPSALPWRASCCTWPSRRRSTFSAERSISCSC